MPLGIQNKTQWSLPSQVGSKRISHIPGLDFMDNFSPVVNDVTF